MTNSQTGVKEKQNIKYGNIDRVLIAGGSSRLPFMKEEIMTVIPTQVKPQNIYVGADTGGAVAIGIACECREQIKKYPDLSVNKLAPCHLTDLYIGFRKSRRDTIVVPSKIKYENKTRTDGQLFVSPFEIAEKKIIYDIELPFDIRSEEKIFFHFNDQPFQENQEISYFNMEQDVFSIKTIGKIKRICQLEIEIKQNGFLKPTFLFQEKGIGAKKAANKVACQEFYIENLKIKEGYPFLGIDFGTSNSYLARFLSIQTETNAATYPEFGIIIPSVMERLRQLELEIRASKDSKILTKNVVFEHADKQKLMMVFHSNKIEGSPLTMGETEDVLRKKNVASLNKNQKEAFNVQSAYEWMLQHHKSWQDESESFIRHLNKTILEDVLDGGGEYRKSPVKIAGMNFTPPHSASVPAFMEKFGQELKKGPDGRSVIEFAASMHTKFVYIHPFVDGNGRTARLLMDSILLANDLPIIIINFADKQRYLDALSLSNEGDISSLVEFFIECFNEQFEELKNQKDISSQDIVDAVTKEQIIDISHNTDPIKDALHGIGLQFTDDPIAMIMQQKIQQLKENTYEGWKQAFHSLLSEVKGIVDSFNGSYVDIGFRMIIREYDMLSFEKFLDISNGKKVSKTWFFSLEIKGPSKLSERFLFFFEKTPFLIEEKFNIKVCLSIVRFDGATYHRFTSEPIKLRKILYSGGDILFAGSSDELFERGEKTMNFHLRSLVADFIQAYC